MAEAYRSPVGWSAPRGHKSLRPPTMHNRSPNAPPCNPISLYQQYRLDKCWGSFFTPTGLARADWQNDPVLARGINVQAGEIVHPVLMQ